MSLDQFIIEEKLGAGAYATVYKVKKISDEKFYALKKVKLFNLTDKERENSLNEVRLLASLRDINIITYKECFLDPSTSSLCILMEYADDGDLFERIKLHQEKKTHFSEKEIWDIFIQVVKGLKALHDLNIFHRDLKTANVFLFKDGKVKLGDFNVSKIAKEGMLKTQTGTPYYASPEVWKDQGYDKKSDIWSLGCILYEMAALHPPFHSEDLEGLSKKVIKGVYHKLPETYSQELNDIIKELLQVLPEKRLNCEMILLHKIIIDKLKERPLFITDEVKPELLKTIKFPKNHKNLHYLSERLPHANYNEIPYKEIDLTAFLDSFNCNCNESKSIKNSSHINENSSLLPKIQENCDNTQILNRNKDLLIIKHKNKLKYQEYIKKPSIKNKKSASPLPKPRYANLKVGRDFLLEPLNITNDENVENGRKLFGHNDYHNKEQNQDEIHDLLHPTFDRQIPLIKRIYGYYKDPFDRKEIMPLKLNSRTNKHLNPLISSENRKFKEFNPIEELKLPKIQRTEQDDMNKEKKYSKIDKIKEIMKAYKIETSDMLEGKDAMKYIKGKS